QPLRNIVHHTVLQGYTALLKERASRKKKKAKARRKTKSKIATRDTRFTTYWGAGDAHTVIIFLDELRDVLWATYGKFGF
ncbi:MAG: hypothetical protein GXP14_06900, partial [Gammaproteobacteria bacterium]|nr:hypothetical protein [Gammaproteobacteria bacterium]